MANRRFLLGMLIMVLAFGMTVIGCDNGTTGNGPDPDLNGTWGFTEEGFSLDYTFNNGSLEISMNYTPYEKATYTTSGNKLTMNITHVYGKSYFTEEIGIDLDAKWYTLTEFFAALKTYLMDEEDLTEEEWAEIEPMIQQSIRQGTTMTYSVNGNTLTLTIDLSQIGGTGTETIIMTRK